MTHSQLKILIVEVIAYSRLVSKRLNIGECISLHQWANLEIVPSVDLKNKFFQQREEIQFKKWERPEQRYDDNLYLYYYCTKKNKWINTNIN